MEEEGNSYVSKECRFNVEIKRGWIYATHLYDSTLGWVTEARPRRTVT
jgi:hypothetical protein